MSDKLDVEKLLEKLALLAALKKMSESDDDEDGKSRSRRLSEKYKELSKKAYAKACRYNVGDRVRIKRWQES